MVAASLTSGQIVSRIEHYRFISAAGLASLATGLFLMSRIDATTSEVDVIRDLVLIGIGFGSNQPIYQNAVQSAVPHKYVGVASSQVQFWRALGQTVGVTVLGAILAFSVGSGAAQTGEAVVAVTGPSPELVAGLQHLFLVASLAAALATVIALALREVPFRGRAVRADAPGVAMAASGVGED
jgi:MFS transporter